MVVKSVRKWNPRVTIVDGKEDNNISIYYADETHRIAAQHKAPRMHTKFQGQVKKVW